MSLRSDIMSLVDKLEQYAIDCDRKNGALYEKYDAERGMHKAAEARLIEAKEIERNLLEHIEKLKAQIATDLVTAYNEVKVARANIFEYQKNLLPTASDVARIARRGYEVGATDLGTAIVAQQQYQQTLANYFDAVVAYQTAWADMERAVGVPLRL